MGFFVFFLIIVAAASWAKLRRLRGEVDDLSRSVDEQQSDIRRLTNRLKLLETSGQAISRVPAPPAAIPEAPPPVPPPLAVEGPSYDEASPPSPIAPTMESQPFVASAAASDAPTPAAPHEGVPFPSAASVDTGPPASERSPFITHEPPQPPPAPPSAPPFQMPAFDWEQLVGVRLFSAIAGIALVLAGIFFLRYSIEHGWLQPPVRVVIGILSGITLLVVCERKAARKYPITANALDAAAIAILFSTFFSAHALWNLIPVSVAFGLLALVTATAVMLSIRRESLFIAVLGLLGGFATPVLLSTGENRPIGLFSYLLLLNVGLAWVAYRQRWPVLTVVTLVLTTLYQWGWVFRFLDASQLPLAAGIFVVFALVGFGGLILSSSRTADDGHGAPFARTALIAAGMPLVFGLYFAAVPGYRDHFWLLFGFLMLVDVGLFAIALSREESSVHVASATITLVVFGVWLATSYWTAAWPEVLGIAGAFVLFYLFAPSFANRVGRPLDARAARTVYAAPILLFVFVVLVAIEPATDAPSLLFGTLLMLLAVVAWRAVATDAGSLYYLAAFLTLAAEALWSRQYLRLERLDDAVALYAVFGLLFLGVPIYARRIGRALQPAMASGIVLLASLAMLAYLSAGSIAGPALWGFALLLAILNAAIFIESAAVGLSTVALAGSAMSWLLMGSWWFRAAGSVGVLPSLLVLVGLTLIMLAGYAWAHKQTASVHGAATGDFRRGFILALAGHLFLVAIASDPRWAIPPWPLFGALAVMTLALLATALASAHAMLHAATFIAAAAVMLTFAATAGEPPWPTVTLAGFATVAAASLVWIPLARRMGFEHAAAKTAAAVLIIGAVGAMIADGQRGAPALPLLVAWHVAALSTLLFLTTRYGWPHVPPAAAAIAGLAAAVWQASHPGADAWNDFLLFSASLFALFVAYPLVLGARARESRDPYVAAVVASGWFFFAARHAVELGGFEAIVGIVPVALGAVMAMLLWQLLRIQPAGARDLGRLALVAAAALAFVTVAIPLQLDRQWITIGWALEGAALAWLFTRIRHRGLLYAAGALLAVVFVRLAANPDVFQYEPRGDLRILNWYLYAYLVSAAAMFAASWWFSPMDDRIVAGVPRLAHLSSAAGAILLFILLNIEIADFYATGPGITFRFGVSIAQDLTYTIGWLVFGLAVLAAGIMLRSRPARVASVALIAVTTFKCFLYDLGSLGGLYRVAAFVGLAASLTLVSIALQKYVLRSPREPA